MEVNEIFGNTCQGEGPFVGQPATFIRLWGCVEPYCEFCDSKYSWSNKEKECTEMSVSEIIKEVRKFGAGKLIVITGGEPAVQNEELSILCKELDDMNYSIQIETSGKKKLGKLPISTTVIMSPKQYNKNFVVASFALQKADYYKFVVENEDEVKRVVDFVEEHNLPIQDVFLMTKGETREKQLDLMPKAFEWCNKYGFRYSPRIHVLAFNVKRKV